MRGARERHARAMTWKRRKRSADPEVPTDPAVFLEGGVPGKYKCVSMLKEQHGEHLYCVSVCALRADHARLFATVGANRASVYRLEDDGGVTLLRAFADDNADEQYYACAWCEASSGELLLAVAGQTGVVRVLDVSAEAKKNAGTTATAPLVFRDLRGHGGSVNDVRAHPCAPHLLLSASKDLSCRLWNVDNGVCVFIFSGALGHRNDVLSVDVKPTPLFSSLSFEDENAKRDKNAASPSDDGDFVFVSGAMDNMVKVWSTRGYSRLLELSERWPEQQKKETDGSYAKSAKVGATKQRAERRDPKDAIPTRRSFGGDAEADFFFAALANGTLDTSTPFPTKHVQHPLFSSLEVHDNYVDCVRWFGDLILSKSVEQKTKMWAFDRRRAEKGEVGSAFRVVREFAAKHADIWFLRFAVDVGAGCVACGNRVGDVFVWNANAAAGYVRGGGGGGRGGAPTPPALVAALSDKHCTKAVRQTAIARGGRTVLAACDGGTVWRWDYVEAPKEKGAETKDAGAANVSEKNVSGTKAIRTTEAKRREKHAFPGKKSAIVKRGDEDEDDVFSPQKRNKRSTRDTLPASGKKNASSRLDALVSDSENPSVVDLLSSDDDADDDTDARGASVFFRVAPRAASRPPPANEESESLSEDAVVIE